MIVLNFTQCNMNSVREVQCRAFIFSYKYFKNFKPFKIRVWTIGTATDYRLEIWDSIPDRGKKMFLFPAASIPLLGLNQTLIQWVGGASSPGVKRQGREIEHPTPSSVKVNDFEASIFPLRHTTSWRGA
jgi:hypothetical protein